MSERSPPAIGDCLILQCQSLTYLLFFIPGLWGFYLSDPYCVTRIATWWGPNNIYVGGFFAVISGVVCRVCRVFSYHSEININIQTWYIFLEFEKVNVVLVRTIELMYLVNRLKNGVNVHFMYILCVYSVCMYRLIAKLHITLFYGSHNAVDILIIKYLKFQV